MVILGLHYKKIFPSKTTKNYQTRKYKTAVEKLDFEILLKNGLIL